MLIINQRRKFILKLETVYFAENYASYKSDADIVLFYLAKEKVSGARTFNTLRIDLTKSEEELFAVLSSSTRNKIRQAKKLQEFIITLNNSPDNKNINEFCENYDEFANTKGIKLSDKRFLAMAKEYDSLYVSELRDSNGNLLCGTAEIHDDKTVLGMYSYSHFRKYSDNKMRNMVSNANRYLYWELISKYRQLGFKTLDMGGLGMGEETSDLDTVDQFKMGFGGEIHTLYHFYHGNSALGRFVMWITGKNKKIEY